MLVTELLSDARNREAYQIHAFSSPVVAVPDVIVMRLGKAGRNINVMLEYVVK